MDPAIQQPAPSNSEVMFQLHEMDFNNTMEAYNATETEVCVDFTLKWLFDVCNIGVQIVIMISMGCMISLHEIIDHMKKPVSIIIAFISQFFVMPASAFGTLTLIEMSGPLSFSAMLVASCPGGSSSNLMTYLSKGDVPLSIMMTTISTTLAIGMMPFNLWLYGSRWTSETIQVPYIPIAITLGWILVPLIVGMILKVRLPKIAAFIIKVGGPTSVIFIIIHVILQHLTFPGTLQQSWKIWLAAPSMIVAGFVFGYILAKIFRQPGRICRTIALETGMQSVSVAMAVIIVSFPVKEQRLMTVFPLIYSISVTVAGFMLASLIHLYFKLKPAPKELTEKEQVANSNV